MTAIRKHLRDFIAIVLLFVVSLGVAGYILSNQRLYLPGWVPVLGQDFYTVKAEFQTAQAVTPGQGQTVNIAGVPVGDITKADLVDGRAVVTMKIKKNKYKYDIYRNAHALLRPKTGLKDMFVELDPGTPDAGVLKSGGTLPIQNTAPDVNLDEVLASLDRDTRDYLQLLLNGGGTALKGNGRQLANVFRRFEPTARYGAEITAELSTRRRNIARVVHNFGQLSSALASKDTQLAQLVDSSNAVFRAFANQDANIRATLSELPSTLNQTNTTLAKVNRLAQTLGPSAQALRPAARALGPALKASRPFLRQTTPIIQNQIRPFTRAALPTVKALRPTAADLAALTPDLKTTFSVANELLNELAYNPPGSKDEGYLFWLAWANHAGNWVFSTQDAHGPVRRGLVITSCATLGILANVIKANPVLGTLTQLLNAPLQGDVCPKTAGAPG